MTQAKDQQRLQSLLELSAEIKKLRRWLRPFEGPTRRTLICDGCGEGRSQDEVELYPCPECGRDLLDQD